METKDTTSISFKPLSEGLGLNHFSDGLPYTPASASVKSRRSSKTGLPLPPARVIVSPAATQQEIKDVAAYLSKAIPQEVSEPFTDTMFPAPKTKRVMAYVIDLFVLTALYAFVLYGAFGLNGYSLSKLALGKSAVSLVAPLALFYAVFYFAYFALQEVTWSNTLGKAALGLRLRAHSGVALVARVVCFFFSVVPLGIGLIWALFDGRGRCWHDVVTDTDVVSP